jgi:hypothetical protein
MKTKRSLSLGCLICAARRSYFQVDAAIKGGKTAISVWLCGWHTLGLQVAVVNVPRR